MNTRLRAAAFASAAIAVGLGAPAAASAKTVGQGANGSKVSVAKGQSLTIKLAPADSGSTGYHWKVAKKPAASVLRLTANRSSSDGKKQVFTYKARGTGTTSLKLQYVPPARGASPVHTFRLGVVVRAAAGPSSCSVAKSKTLASNGEVRVYELKTGDGTTLNACSHSTGKRTMLDHAFDDGFTTSSVYSNVRLNGHFVGWSSVTTDNSCKADCPPGYNPTVKSILVYDVAQRKSRTVDAFPVGKALVVSNAGGVAWAAQPTSPGPVEIHASVRQGDNRTLDTGDIDPNTLAVELTIISWTNGGTEHFARLR